MRSLSTSLSQLESDATDILFLHDCTPADWLADDLRHTLDTFVADGRVGSYGTATTFADTQGLLSNGSLRPPVMQFDSDAFNGNVERIRSQAGDSTLITYSCLSQAFPRIHEHVSNDSTMADDWTRTLDVDVRSRDEFIALLLCSAVQANPEGLTLFSSGDPIRIARNASAVSAGRYDDAQLREFARLVHALPAVMHP